MFILRQMRYHRKYAQNQNNLIKEMFFCAFARPCFDDNGSSKFNRKIGLRPFVKEVEAQRRSSNNQPRRTIITRVVTCDKDRYREYSIQKVLLAINWPDRDQQIVIQQDGASAHAYS